MRALLASCLLVGCVSAPEAEERDLALLARRAEQRADWSEAGELWQELYEAAPAPEAALGLGRVLRATGDDAGALRILGSADPQTSEVRLALAALHEGRRSVDLAIATLDLARAEDPDSVPVRRELARLYVRRGRWAEARSVLVEATTLDPRAADLWEQRIAAHAALDQGREALDAYRALEAVRPLDHDQAIEAAQLALTLPASAPLSQVAGWLSRVNESDPSRGEAWSLMGELQARMGNEDARLVAVQSGLEADPGNLVLLGSLVELRGAREDWDGLEALRRHAGLLGRVELVARIDALLAARPAEEEVEGAPGDSESGGDELNRR